MNFDTKGSYKLCTAKMEGRTSPQNWSEMIATNSTLFFFGVAPTPHVRLGVISLQSKGGHHSWLLAILVL